MLRPHNLLLSWHSPQIYGGICALCRCQTVMSHRTHVKTLSHRSHGSHAVSQCWEDRRFCASSRIGSTFRENTYVWLFAVALSVYSIYMYRFFCSASCSLSAMFVVSMWSWDWKQQVGSRMQTCFLQDYVSWMLKVSLDLFTTVLESPNIMEAQLMMDIICAQLVSNWFCGGSEVSSLNRRLWPASDYLDLA